MNIVNDLYEELKIEFEHLEHNQVLVVMALALEKIPNATVTDIETDKENGVLVYEVDLIKGKKEYKIIFFHYYLKLIETLPTPLSTSILL